MRHISFGHRLNEGDETSSELTHQGTPTGDRNQSLLASAASLLPSHPKRNDTIVHSPPKKRSKVWTINKKHRKFPVNPGGKRETKGSSSSNRAKKSHRAYGNYIQTLRRVYLKKNRQTIRHNSLIPKLSCLFIIFFSQPLAYFDLQNRITATTYPAASWRLGVDMSLGATGALGFLDTEVLQLWGQLLMRSRRPSSSPQAAPRLGSGAGGGPKKAKVCRFCFATLCFL